MRDIRVKVSNDRERDAVLRQFERDGLKWRGRKHENPTNFKPSMYPYYLFRRDGIYVTMARDSYCISDVKEVPVSTFLKLDKDAEIEEIRVKVHNDKERDAVLRQFEREGLKWAGNSKKPTEWHTIQTYPYYLLRRRDCFGGGIVTYSKCIHNTSIREVSVRAFLELAELDKDVITITSDGKTVIAEMGGRKGVAKCSPDDEFSLETGAKLALDRMFGLQAGDKVRCVNGGYSFTTFVDAIKMHCDKDMCVRYAYNTNMRAGEVGEVKYLLEHPFGGETMAVVDTSGYDSEAPVYLIGVKGIEKID